VVTRSDGRTRAYRQKNAGWESHQHAEVGGQFGRRASDERGLDGASSEPVSDNGSRAGAATGTPPSTDASRRSAQVNQGGQESGYGTPSLFRDARDVTWAFLANGGNNVMDSSPLIIFLGDEPDGYRWFKGPGTALGDQAAEFGEFLSNFNPAKRVRIVLGGIERGATAAARGLTHWGNPKTLADHFARHGKDFGAKSADDYARQASDFFRRSQAERLPTKIDADGVIRVYDPKSNTFGAFNPDGTTRTLFKPRSSTYFDRQPGSPPWGP
jgi:hypothetical protein